MVWFRFETREIEDPEATAREGKWTSRQEHWVSLLISQYAETPLRVEDYIPQIRDPVDRERFVASYEAWKRGEEAPLNGTSVKDWPQISRAQAEAFWSKGLRTIEDIAGATDTQLDHVGPGSRAVQIKAKAWLETAKSQGVASEELASLRSENASLRDQVGELKAMVNELAANQKKASGRPRKEAA